ncbi:hypothetical protein B0A52_01663 [Exophiala mesophila]|uniref:Xylanolytic transcriptional activator regulatory domain-containing protein n=1 Tax=Exophiala mesophila TaxID=212818 RepID=A0A438NFN4_EXOME|nr:hypothetical protein B0A52_01663 [Exophiala mesophila]
MSPEEDKVPGTKKNITKHKDSNTTRHPSISHTASPNFDLLDAFVNDEGSHVSITTDTLSDSRSLSARHSSNQDADFVMQDQIVVQNRPVQLTSNNITSAKQARPASHPGRHLHPENLHQTEDQHQSWGIPDTAALDLIHIFFDNIQPWLPIMHRPSFFNRYIRRHNQQDRLVEPQSLPTDHIIMMLSMFALSARFSKAACFDGIDPVTRGIAFAERAAVLKDPIIRTVEEASTELLKACVILASHCLTAGQMASGAVLLSVCVRFAYNLGLNDLDDEQICEDGTVENDDLDDSEAWVRKEELRRVWWAISDLDTFLCTVSSHPFGLDRQSMRVLLPVSDELWFKGVPTKSSVLLLHPSQIWKSLQNSNTQPARTWFLMSNQLSSSVADAARRPSNTSPEQVAELESALGCFKMAMPASFQLKQLHFDDSNFAECHWILSTHLMIMACETLLQQVACHKIHRNSLSSFASDPTAFGKRFHSMLVTLAQIWPQEYIPLIHPTMCCALINTRDVVLEDNHPAKTRCTDLSRLLIKHFASYWKLGSASLRLIDVLADDVTEKSQSSASDDRMMIKHFSALDPKFRKRRRMTSSTRDSQESPNQAVNIGVNNNDLPTPSFSSVGSPGDLQWPQVNFWDHIQDFEIDQYQTPMTRLFSNIIPVDPSGQDPGLQDDGRHGPMMSM